MEIKSKLLKHGAQIPYKVFHEGGKEHYNVRLFLSARASELQSIKKVEYRLHPSFRNSRRVSTDRENQFAIDIWTWGMFDIQATVYFTDGRTDVLDHYVKYSLPADDGKNYLLV